MSQIHLNPTDWRNGDCSGDSEQPSDWLKSDSVIVVSLSMNQGWFDAFHADEFGIGCRFIQDFVSLRTSISLFLLCFVTILRILHQRLETE